MRKLAVASSVVESVTNHEIIGNGEAYPIRFEWSFAASGFIEENAGADGRGIPRDNFVLNARQRVARIQYVVDEEDVSALDLGSEAAQHARA